MKAARQDPARERAATAGHAPLPRRRAPGWLVAALVPVALVLAVAARDAVAWVGRPFAGFLFSDGRIVFSIARPQWLPATIRRPEWSVVSAVDGTPVASGGAVHDAVRAAGAGRELTYTFRRGAEVFRLALPARRFGWDDFAEVFAPMLGVGTWVIALGALPVALRPARPEVRAHFIVCLLLGLMLLTSPDEYGPYRLLWIFFLALALLPPAILHLAASVLGAPGRWRGRVLGGLYVVFAALGATLVLRRFDAPVFLPLLYLVYCALANALLLYAGVLVSVLATRDRPRRQTLAALAAILGSGGIVIAILVTYPLRTEGVSVPWFILPIGLWPVLHAIGFLAAERRRPVPRVAS
jgi:hypothetical protein